MHCSTIILGFSRDVCATWFQLSGFVTPAVKISRLLVPRVSHLFMDSHRNILWWILHMRASLMLIPCRAHRLTYFDFLRKRVSGFGSLEGMMHRLVSGFRLLAKFWLPKSFIPHLIQHFHFFLSADRREHPSESGGNPQDQHVFPRGQSTNICLSLFDFRILCGALKNSFTFHLLSWCTKTNLQSTLIVVSKISRCKTRLPECTVPDPDVLNN